jgi:hypothetical protein
MRIELMLVSVSFVSPAETMLESAILQHQNENF